MEKARSAPRLSSLEISKMSCVAHLIVPLVDITRNPSSPLHLLLHIPQRPLHLSYPLSVPPPSCLACGLFLPLLFSLPGVAAAAGHDVVVAARRFGLLASGVRRCRSARDRPAPQGVQREELEASAAVGDRQQTERREAKER